LAEQLLKELYLPRPGTLFDLDGIRKLPGLLPSHQPKTVVRGESVAKQDFAEEANRDRRPKLGVALAALELVDGQAAVSPVPNT
jgi:hypothetical protein